jgi:hypothetical protein
MIYAAAGNGGHVVLNGVIRILKLILPSDERKQIFDSRCCRFVFLLAFRFALSSKCLARLLSLVFPSKNVFILYCDLVFSLTRKPKTSMSIGKRRKR